MLRSLFLIVLLILSGVADSSASSQVVKRDILTLWSGTAQERLEYTAAHLLAEMPLNHMGYILRYHNIETGLPPADSLSKYRAVLVWFSPGHVLDDPLAFISFLEQAMDKSLPVILMDAPDLFEAKDGSSVPLERVNALYHRLGLEIKDDFSPITYDLHYSHIDRDYMEFEKNMPVVIPPFTRVLPYGKSATPLLTVGRKETSEFNSILAAISPAGGYVAPHFVFQERLEEEKEKKEHIEGLDKYIDESEKEEDTHGHLAAQNFRQWYVNPFTFFSAILDTEPFPIPDTTTVNGLRIFYSHIDGDGWNNLSEVPKYKNLETLSTEVVLNELLAPYPEFPVSVAPIAGDLDAHWVGKKRGRELAREIFALPYIEAASHTYSHPFEWHFFENYTQEREKPYLGNYAGDTWSDISLKSWLTKDEPVNSEPVDATCPVDRDFIHDSKNTPYALENAYDVPRAYARKPFDLGLEICGAVNYISRFLPEGKKIKLVQWSGDTSPYEEVLAMARSNGLYNINGGDSRYDPEYPSYSWVAPLGRQVGQERQIYASNSNENTYTESWSGRYYGFKYLLRTINNTESPMRIKPFNVYYHMYSGEKLASLNAIRNNLEFARTRSFHPLWTSDYAALVNGFYTTKITSISKNRWKIDNRSTLNTVRFDKTTLKTVDYTQSIGVLGHRHYQGSLYIALDPQVKPITLAIKPFTSTDKYHKSSVPYLYSSNWNIENVQQQEDGFTFEARGFGNGEIHWLLPREKALEVIHIRDNDKEITPSHNSETLLTYKSVKEPVTGHKLIINLNKPQYENSKIRVKY